jgi:hypothetical protein
MATGKTPRPTLSSETKGLGPLILLLFAFYWPTWRIKSYPSDQPRAGWHLKTIRAACSNYLPKLEISRRGLNGNSLVRLMGLSLQRVQAFERPQELHRAITLGRNPTQSFIREM